MPELITISQLSLQGLVSNLDLKVCTGQSVVILTPGERECKCLVQTLLGEYLPDEGSISFCGHQLHEVTYEQSLTLRRSLNLVSDRFGLISNLKLWENITLPLLYHTGTLSDAASQQASSLLDELGYTGNIWALPAHLASHDRIIATFVRGVLSSASVMLYTDVLQELPAQTRGRLQTAIGRYHNGIDAPAAIFVTSGDEPFPFIQIDTELDLRRDSND